MVSEAYLLQKPAPPSAAKRFVDQRLIPRLINVAGAVEQEFERVAVAARAAPLASLTVAFATGCLLRESFAKSGRH